VVRHRCSEDGGIVRRPQLTSIQQIGPEKTPHVNETNQRLQLDLREVRHFLPCPNKEPDNADMQII
jgi:hypothetical protein